IRRDAAALLRLASKSWPASAERRLRNDAWDSVIGSPALFHSSGGRSSGFGTCDVRAAAMPALGGAEDQRGVVSAKAHRVGERRLDRPCTCVVRHIVQIERGIRRFVVDRWWNTAIAH